MARLAGVPASTFPIFAASRNTLLYADTMDAIKKGPILYIDMVVGRIVLEMVLAF